MSSYATPGTVALAGGGTASAVIFYLMVQQSPDFSPYLLLALVLVYVPTYIALGYLPVRKPSQPLAAAAEVGSSLPSCILPCITSHRRLLPVQATHAFEYPLIYLGLDLDDLQSGKLNLDSRYFRYNANPLTAVLGIKFSSYIMAESPARQPGETEKTFKDQLLDLLRQHGIAKETVGRVWMITMPSYLGFKGINPLTVYLCYASESTGRGHLWKSAGEATIIRGTPESEECIDLEPKEVDEKVVGTEASPEESESAKGRRLLCVVLEVHNTFGERHAYVLKAGVNEAAKTLSGHDRGWIFPRTFHVSPFNDRAGYYRLDILDPFPHNAPVASAPEPFKITLNQLTADKRFKLYAVLMNHSGRSPLPITTENIFQSILLRQPFDLFMTTPRILYQAYVLHYARKLLVYPRPEPATEPGTTGLDEPWNSAGKDERRVGVGLGWQGVGFGEKQALRVIGRWMTAECGRMGMKVEITFSNPARATLNFGKNNSETGLRIWTRHPGFFTELLMTRSPELVLLAADTDKHTKVSSPQLFSELFACPPTAASTRWTVYLRNVRMRYFLFLASFATSPIPPSLVGVQGDHFLDGTLLEHPTSAVLMLLVACLQYTADRAEEWIMYRVGAKFVTGREPWGTVARLVDTQWSRPIGLTSEGKMADTYGSIMMDSAIPDDCKQ